MVVDGVTAGYGSVKGKDNLIDRDAVFEFYLIPAYRRYGLDIFRGFISESSTAFIECPRPPVIDPFVNAWRQEHMIVGLLLTCSECNDYYNE